MLNLMKTCAWLCAGVFCTGALAGTPGVEEYRKASVAREALSPLAYELFNADPEAIKRLPAADKEAMLKRFTALNTEYREQLRASAMAGFAPGQYMYAVLLKTENSVARPPKTDRSEVCKLLNDASGQGFTAASLGRSQYCNSLTAITIENLIAANKARRTSLQSDIDRQDPYGEFYPVVAFEQAECFLPNRSKALEEMTTMELAELRAPQWMDLGQFKAEMHFQLGSLDRDDSPDMALRHLASASEFGCSGQMLERMQERLTRRK